MEPRSLVVAGGRVYLSGTSGNQQALVRAFDAASGRLLWSFDGPRGDYQLAPMAATSDGARVFVGVEEGAAAVHALDGATGGRLFAVGYFPGDGFDIASTSLDPATGHDRWTGTYSTGAWERAWRAAVAPAGWLAIGADRQVSDAPGLLALRVDPASGGIEWVSVAPARPSWAQLADVVVAGDRVVLAGISYPAYPSTDIEEMMLSSASTVAFDGASGTLLASGRRRAPLLRRGEGARRVADGSRIFTSVNGAGGLVASYLASGL